MLKKLSVNKKIITITNEYHENKKLNIKVINA